MADHVEVARERKVVTILFCDLVGFTAASEQLDPEDVQSTLQSYHRTVRSVIERFGGTVEKFIGDAVVGVFGAPRAHEDDPERAVHAGLAILSSIADLNAADAVPRALAVRIGVNTGEAVVALAARPELGEGMVAGDVVNTAARIQSAAPVGTIAVGAATRRQTERRFDFEELEPVVAKGKAAPVGLSRVVSARPREREGATRSLRPLVGRDAELGALDELLAEVVRERSPRVVMVVGAAGIGKSRIIDEFERTIAIGAEPAAFRRGHCRPYGEGAGIAALGEVVKRHAGIADADSSATAREKLDATLTAADDRAWLRGCLLPLIGVDPGIVASRDEVLAAWTRYVGDLAESGPLVLVVEDVHWADAVLVAFLRGLVEIDRQVPLLVVCTARLEGASLDLAPLAASVATIPLDRLSDADTERLALSLIGDAADPAMAAAIVDRAGGNPLFAEEYARLVSGPSAGDRRADDAPDTIVALVSARLDALPADAKDLLQDASVFGAGFSAATIATMADRAVGDVERTLGDLVRAELLRSRATSPTAGGLEYVFWHEVVRDVAYRQIPRVPRARRHQAAGRCLERRAADGRIDLADVLAHHYTTAIDLLQAAREPIDDLVAPAVRHLRASGERILGLDSARALVQLTRALELAVAEDPGRPAILLLQARALLQTGRHHDARVAAEAALAAAPAVRTPAVAVDALDLLAELAGDYAEHDLDALALLREALEIAARELPAPALCDRYAALAALHCVRLKLDEAIAAADRSLALAEDEYGLVTARALGFRGAARLLRGEPDGLADMRRAIDIMVAGGDAWRAFVLMNNVAVLGYPLEGPARTLGAIKDAATYCTTRGMTEGVRSMQAMMPGVLADLGRTSAAMELAIDVAAELRAVDRWSLAVEPEIVLLALRASTGEAQEAAEGVGAVLEAARASGYPDAVVTGLVAAARVPSPLGATGDVRAYLEELDAYPGASDAPHFPRVAAEIVRLAVAAGSRRLAERLEATLTASMPLHRCARASAQAVLAEDAGDHASAESLYAVAAVAWEAFGHVPERAHAMLGRGRCQLVDGGDARGALVTARQAFVELGYAPFVAEIDALLTAVDSR